MAEFTINGTQNIHLVQPVQELLYKPTYTLADSQISILNTEYVNCIFQTLEGLTKTPWLSEYRIKENATVYGAVNQGLVELQFMLGDRMEHYLEGFGQVEVPSCSLNLYHQPYVENKVFFPKGKKMITFDVHVDPEDLQDMVSVLPALGPFLETIAQEKFASLQKKAIPASPDLMMNIHSILQTPSRPGLQNRIIEPQIDSLVFNALCYLTQSSPKPVKATQTERKAVEGVWNYLKTELDSPLTIKQLSKAFAINQQKLKALFSEQYGMAIHEFTIQERMNRACLLLKKADASIQDIAFSVGYRTAGSFAEIFKKKFLVSPLQYRKTMK